MHSAKDMQTQLPPGLIIAACLPREDPRDVLVSRTSQRIADLPTGARIGTSSLRRAALMRRLRRDIVVVPLRGNVETRLRKLDEGVADATLLALAGLRRLGLESVASAVLDPNEFVLAVGQGVIAIETRADDTARARAGRKNRRCRCGDALARSAHFWPSLMARAKPRSRVTPG